MSSRLATMVRKDRGEAPIIKVKPGVFGLRDFSDEVLKAAKESNSRLTPQWRKLPQETKRLGYHGAGDGAETQDAEPILRSWTVKRVMKSPTATTRTLTTTKGPPQRSSPSVAVGEERAGQTRSAEPREGRSAKGALEKGVHVAGVLGGPIVRRAGMLKLRVIGSEVLRVGCRGFRFSRYRLCTTQGRASQREVLSGFGE